MTTDSDTMMTWDEPEAAGVEWRAYQHSCGGWYTAEEDDDGFHHQPSGCVVSGWGECYDTPDVALRVARGELDGSRPDGGDPAPEVGAGEVGAGDAGFVGDHRPLAERGPSNRTADDAAARLSLAKVSSLVNPSREYLTALLRGLDGWRGRIADTLAQLPEDA